VKNEWQIFKNNIFITENEKQHPNGKGIVIKQHMAQHFQN
jgi:hypothetical protein